MFDFVTTHYFEITFHTVINEDQSFLAAKGNYHNIRLNVLIFKRDIQS